MSKELAGEFKGDRFPAQVVDLAASWPLTVPLEGFELVEGVTAIRADRLRPPELFLVALPGPSKEVHIPDDLYIEFSQLTPEGIPNFSARYGCLRGPEKHFHRQVDMLPAEGEPLSYWLRQIKRLRDTMDLCTSREGQNPSR
jgi:hypothetical protein